MLMAAHCQGLHIDGVEIQPEIADMARRSVILNGLQDRMRIFQMDMRDAWQTFGAGAYTLAVCNPPYGRSGGGLENESEAKRIARHEGDIPPDAVAEAASRLLSSGGKFCVIYPAPRIFEMMTAMEHHHLAPKRIRTVHGVEGRAPKFVLLDAVKDGGAMLHWQPPLNLRDAGGEYTEEWRRIYRMDE